MARLAPFSPTAKALVDHVFSRYGFPRVIISDQGANFDSQLIKEMCELLKIHKCRTTAYSPKANGAVERMNKIVIAAVRAFIGQKQDEWDENLQLIAMAMRAAKNRHTGQSPNRIMLGRELQTPIELIYPLKEEKAESPENYVEELEEQLKKAHELAREKLKTEILRTKKRL